MSYVFLSSPNRVKKWINNKFSPDFFHDKIIITYSL